MSRDKTTLTDANMPPSLTQYSVSCFFFLLISLLMSLPSYRPLASLFVILCCSRCPFLSPAVSLSGLGVEFGDSVQWILLWLRPKILRPHGAAAPPGPLPAHPFLFSFFVLLFLALELHPIPTPPPPDLSPLVSLFLSLCVTYCSEETPCDSSSTGSCGQGHSLPGFQS